jgi:hypothetical protein
MSLRIMAWASGAILLAVFVALLAVLKAPRRYRAGDDAMGEGCVMMVLWIIAAVGLVLGLGAAFSVRWLVYAIFVMTAGPAVLFSPFLVSELWKDHRKRVAARGVRVPPAELESRLLGRTHVSGEYQDERGRLLREFRHYGPGGRLTIHQEEAGAAAASPPRQATWSIENGRLAILDPAMSATHKQRFTLKQPDDGKIDYYIHEPLSPRLHGRLSFRAAEIREDEITAVDSKQVST